MQAELLNSAYLTLSNEDTMITWQFLPFSQLTTTQLYQLLKLRVDIFVVEQTCPYPELDDKDHQPGVHHLLGYQDDQLIACARLLPKGLSYPSVSIGSVAILETKRGGTGHQLMAQALKHCESLYWERRSKSALRNIWLISMENMDLSKHHPCISKMIFLILI